MSTQVCIAGAAGRMGLNLVRCARRFPDLSLVACLDQASHPSQGQDAGRLAGIGDLGVPISADPEAVARGDVLVDFSFHSAVPTHVAAAARHGRAVVIGTTGLDEKETAAVHACAARVPVMWSPNMSLGVNLLFALVEKAAGVLGLDYDIEVIETHHRLKKDSPSGTALKLAEHAAAGRGQKFRDVACYGREGIVGERPRGEIGVHAVRGGDVVGDHIVRFAQDGEVIDLCHRATSRETFAMGALRAALWVCGQRPGLYTMKDVLGL
jgi:4-hydroxy-tetrahydrodipicolinate reductase